jgi:hypothetical protein
MPQRPPTLAERLRSVWSHASEMAGPSGPEASTPALDSPRHKGSDFAARLRAAVAARH